MSPDWNIANHRVDFFGWSLFQTTGNNTGNFAQRHANMFGMSRTNAAYSVAEKYKSRADMRRVGDYAPN